MSAKELWTSADGGTTWQLISHTVAYGGSRSSAEDIPESGHLAELVMVGRTSGWLALDRTTLYGSHDGGRTWLAAQGIDGVDGASEVSFTDPDHGWAVANGLAGSIYQTTDGGVHWRLHGPLAAAPSPG